MNAVQKVLRLVPNFRLWQKLALVSFTFVLPIVTLLSFMVTEQQKPIDFAKKEMAGTEYLRPCRQLYEHIGQHRLLTNRQFAKEGGAGDLLAVRERINTDFQALDKVNAKSGKELSQTERTTDQYLKAMKDTWESIQRPGLNQKDAEALHVAFIKDLRSLIALVGDTSNLILDPDLDSYYTMDAVLLKLPEGIDQLGNMVNYGNNVLGNKKLSNEERTQIIVVNGQISALYSALNSPYAGLPVAYKKDNDSTEGKQLEALLAPPLGRTSAAVDNFTAQVQTGIIDPAEVTLKREDFDSQGGRAVDASFALWDESVNSLDTLLQNRIDRFRRSQFIALGASFVSVFFAFSFVLLLVRGVNKQITSIDKVLEQISVGVFTARTEVTSADELGKMAGSLNSMLDNTTKLISSRDERDQIQKSIMKLLDEMSGVADGDLTKDAEVTADMTGAIADSFNFMMEQLRGIIGNVQQATTQVTTAAGQIQSTAEHLASGSETQAEQILDTSAAVDEMAVSIAQVSDNAAQSAKVAENAIQKAKEGTAAVNNTIEGMNRIRGQVQETAKRIKRLGESSQQIGEIVQLIDDIAERTSILALNASIQAAMAGDAGRGFAVVAEEVERLAERSTGATKKIATLIKTIQTEANEAITAMEAGTREVVEGSKLANQAGQSLQQIEQVSQQLEELIQSISLASKQQARASEGVAKSMNEISGVTQQTAAGTKQAALSVNELATLASRLRGSVGQFRLPGANGNGDGASLGSNGHSNGHANGHTAKAGV